MTTACEKAEQMDLHDMIDLIVSQVGNLTVDVNWARGWEKACLAIVGEKEYRRMRQPYAAALIYAYPERYEDIVYGEH